MDERESIAENFSQEKSKWFTYGGKVDESLMNMLKEAQKAAGIKKFSDFMNDMLKIYRENKADSEPPQMLVIKKAVTDILTTTESLLGAIQIIEDDKFKAIAEYQERTQAAEEHTLEAQARIKELEKHIDDIKKDLASSQTDVRSAQTELSTEIERRKAIEGMIARIQQLADEALAQKQEADAKLNTTLAALAEAETKITHLEDTNKDLQNKHKAALTTIDRISEELALEAKKSHSLLETLQLETITRNRLEERLQILEPQYQTAYEKLTSLQSEIVKIQLSEQALSQKAVFLESELHSARAQLQAPQQSASSSNSR